MKFRAVQGAIFFFLIAATPVYSWGDKGHMIVCDIAYRELAPTAKAKMKYLLGKSSNLLQNNPGYRRYSTSCTWADKPKKRRKEHYVNLQRSADGFEDASCPTASKCLLTAILKDMVDLALGSDEAKRLKAMLYLGHWLGDLHQPLHVSFSDDRGGNDIVVTGNCTGNLHGAWDTCMIERRLTGRVGSLGEGLHREVTNSERESWTAGDVDEAAIQSWANESYAIARDARVQYCVKKNNACSYNFDNKTLDTDDTKKRVRVDDSYIDQHMPTIETRLKQAGIRLGHILNKILDD